MLITRVWWNNSLMKWLATYSWVNSSYWGIKVGLKKLILKEWHPQTCTWKLTCNKNTWTWKQHYKIKFFMLCWSHRTWSFASLRTYNVMGEENVPSPWKKIQERLCHFHPDSWRHVLFLSIYPESPIARPAGLHPTSTLDACTINRTHRQRPGRGKSRG